VKLGFAIAVGLMACATGGWASAAAPKPAWESFTDTAYGIRVSIPKTWFTVPPTVAEVQALIKRLDQTNDAGLANVYAQLIGTSAARTQLLRYLFQAFDYSPASAQQPDFALAYARTTKAVAGNPASLSASFAKSYAAEPGTTVTKHAVVKLPAGPAAFVEGTQRVAGAASQQFEVFILGHGTLLYTLAFRAEVSAPGAAAAFAGIAQRFTFT
jgi:hypothetical protein